MFGKILYISDALAHVENISTHDNSADLMNMHVIFEENDQRILGEVDEVNKEYIKIRFLGEYINNKYINGVIRKPMLTSSLRTINDEELLELTGKYDETTFDLGTSSIYKKFKLYPKINDLLSNHFGIFGNSGSGKSWGTARVIQSIFSNPKLVSYNANVFIFDAYGEYRNAFNNLAEINPNYTYKFITTHPQEQDDLLLQIPLFLLDLDDMALLLQAHDHTQLPIIERTLRLVKIFAVQNDTARQFKNHLIAKALLAVLFSNQTTASKKNDVFRIIKSCNTPDFNFDTQIQGVGYSRTFAECFEIDSYGNFGESVLVNKYILSMINDDLEKTESPEDSYYKIDDFRKALEFTLISEGFQGNESLYDDAIMLKVRLNSIIANKVSRYFDYPKYITRDSFVSSLVMKQNRKSQIINVNLEDCDDIYAKVIVKVISKMLFEFAKSRKERASIPFHLFLEEAHRYVQKDADTFLIGYNIFDRIAKEGRKYGVLLNIISQRPVELSDTVISQCSNFLIFKMTHPKDVMYIKEMLPNISADVIEKQKILQPGNCVGFGSAFKIPFIIKMDVPSPAPHSNSADVSARWKLSGNPTQTPPITQPVQSSTPIVEEKMVAPSTKEENVTITELNNITQESQPLVQQSPINTPTPEVKPTVMPQVKTPEPPKPKPETVLNFDDTTTFQPVDFSDME